MTISTLRLAVARNVAVTIVEDLLTVPSAELAIGSMIALGRHVLEADAFVRSGRHRRLATQFYGTGLGARGGLIKPNVACHYNI